MEKITVLGAGAWGLTLANVLSDNGHQVLLWSIDKNTVNEINKDKTAEKYLKNLNVILNDNVFATTDLEEAVNFSKYIVLTLPTQVLRGVLEQLNLKEPKIFINGAKGIEISTAKVISQIIEDVIDPKYIEGNVTISGPSHAEELILRKITAVCVAAKDIELAKKVRLLFSNNYFKIYVSDKQLEIQYASALKNVIAIGSGIVSGLGYGDNTKAALVTRGLVEMNRFTNTLTGSKDALFGLAGLGDLVVTAYSPHSRNYMFGYYIGKGNKPKEAKELVGATIEGLETIKIVKKIAEDKNISMPITDAIYKVVFKNEPTNQVLLDLMNRENIFEKP